MEEKKKKLRGAIVGFGFIAMKGHMPAYVERMKNADDIEIVAICDISYSRCGTGKKLFPDIKIYKDYEVMLLLEKNNLDFVDIATPVFAHADFIKSALKCGLHVLCEKPVTMNVKEFKEVINVAKENQRVVFPCHNYKHAPVVKAINEIIASGKVGDIRSVTLNTFRNTHAKGVQEWNSEWRRFKEFSGGGIAMDHGSHTFYLTFNWLKSFPTGISAYSLNTLSDKYDTEDNFNATLTFPKGQASVHLSWTAGVRKVLYSLQGTKGAITVDDDQMEVAIMGRENGPDRLNYSNVSWETEKYSISSNWMDSSHVTWFNSLLDQFIGTIDANEYLNKDLLEAYLCIETIHKGYESAKENSIFKKLSGGKPEDDYGNKLFPF